MTAQFKTPVVIIVFKRLDATKKMFDAVRKAAPQELFVIADGWRSDAEKEKCLAVRTFLDETINWPCVVHKNYSNTNLGCKMRVVSGLDWVFSQAEEAIIIEDDCVLDQSFFPFCQELLEKYRNEPRIMQIAAMNIQQKNPHFHIDDASYYFSQLGEIWGWATWRRVWNLYDANMSEWPKVKKEGLLRKNLKDPAVFDYFEYRFDQAYKAGYDRKKSDVWGAPWMFALLSHNGIAIVPKTNLVSNVGDDKDATNFKGNGAEFIRVPTVPVAFPLIHPKNININKQADAFTLKINYRIKRRLDEKILFFLKRYIPILHTTLKRL